MRTVILPFEAARASLITRNNCATLAGNIRATAGESRSARIAVGREAACAAATASVGFRGCSCRGTQFRGRTSALLDAGAGQVKRLKKEGHSVSVIMPLPAAHSRHVGSRSENAPRFSTHRNDYGNRRTASRLSFSR